MVEQVAWEQRFLARAALGNGELGGAPAEPCAEAGGVVGRKFCVPREQGEWFDERLRDKGAIERIGVMPRQPRHPDTDRVRGG